MELSPWAALFAVVLATALFLKAIPSRGHRRAYNLPPGPKPWPIIGNLNLLGELPHRSTRELSSRYGLLMQLWFGSMPVVVGSSAERFDRSKITAGETDFKFKMLPFGSGRQMCPAFSLGLKVIALSLANLLHGFAWRLPDGMDVGAP